MVDRQKEQVHRRASAGRARRTVEMLAETSGRAAAGARAAATATTPRRHATAASRPGACGGVAWSRPMTPSPRTPCPGPARPALRPRRTDRVSQLRAARGVRLPASAGGHPGVGARPPPRPAVRATGRRRAAGRRVHPRHARIRPGPRPPRRRAAPATLGPRRRLPLRTRSRSGSPAFEAAVGSAMARRPHRPPTSCRCCRTARRRARSAPTATPPTTSCSSTSRPTTRRSPCRPSRRPSVPRRASRWRSPADRRSTATSRPCPRADLRRSEVISLPLAGLALILVFGSLVAAAVPLAVGGSAVVVALAVIFGLASLTPMSIFVLNLATLLGLGLGVDYSLLLTSRFREELAARATWRALPDGPRSRPRPRRGHRDGGPDHRRDGRPGRLLLGADRPARADRADPVPVHDPALGRHRRRRRRRAGGRSPRSRSCRRSWACSVRASTRWRSAG